MMYDGLGWPLKELEGLQPSGGELGVGNWEGHRGNGKGLKESLGALEGVDIMAYRHPHRSSDR